MHAYLIISQNRRTIKALQTSSNRELNPWLPRPLLNAILARRVGAATFRVLAGQERQQSVGDMELISFRPDSTPFLNEEASRSSSLRSSLENDYYQSQGCDIQIYDDILSDTTASRANRSRGFAASTWHGGLENREGFTQHLKVASLC